MNDLLEINDYDREAIAEQVKQGYTSGRLDQQDEKGESIYITWSIDIEKWQDKG